MAARVLCFALHSKWVVERDSEGAGTQRAVRNQVRCGGVLKRAQQRLCASAELVAIGARHGVTQRRRYIPWRVRIVQCLNAIPGTSENSTVSALGIIYVAKIDIAHVHVRSQLLGDQCLKRHVKAITIGFSEVRCIR
jgi:hypothetical protein